MTLQQKISRANDKTYLAGAEVVLVCLDNQFKAVRIPDPLRVAMRPYEIIAV
jgi:acyl-CoA thioesterase FadM